MQRRLPLVTSVIAAPCDVPWSSMAGDDRKRHCGECKRDVHNLSAMTEAEMAAFLEAAAALPANQHAPCVSLFQRADGTVLTADCPVGVSRRRRRAFLTATLQLGAVALVAVTALATVLLHQRPAALSTEPEPPPPPAVLVATPVAYPVPAPATVTPSHLRDPDVGTHRAGGIRAVSGERPDPPKPKVSAPPRTRVSHR